MGLLEGLLAFALTILVFANVVSAAVEFVQRVGKARARGFHRMMLAYWGRDLPEVLKANGAGPAVLDGLKTQSKADFIGEMVRHPVAGLDNAVLCRGDTCDLSKMVEKLDSTEFRDRLSTTQIGGLIAADPAAPKLMDALVKRFEVMGRAASEQFARNARTLSIPIGIALALAINLDSIHLLSRYLTEEPLRQTIIAKFPAAPAVAVPAPGDPAVDADAFKAMTEYAQLLRKEMDGMRTQGFPVGWDQYPNCSAKDGTDSRCVKAGLRGMDGVLTVAGHDHAVFAKWAVGVLISGLLVGLGAPFWFEVVQRLMQARSGLRAVTPNTAQQGGTNLGGTNPGAAG
ncbi:hypothetical protein [Magnetospirillum sp. UT-4]|uniref:hypothetical protein n=1 Tax=Magnetospirillum sp. UT-4 TaxID=2681467 RepID=UPI00137FD072|nr:hypothetical protein [Magnetospirillum sp. UT-4]CAA7620287.1 exported hypothetical protein [Magnetospirillum sp. UT-4]